VLAGRICIHFKRLLAAFIQDSFGGGYPWTINIPTINLTTVSLRHKERPDFFRSVIDPGPVLPGSGGPLTGHTCELVIAVFRLVEKNGDAGVVRVSVEEADGFHLAEVRHVVAGIIFGHRKLFAVATSFLLGV